jgi:tetratricopeptide (TPR) repeat protein
MIALLLAVATAVLVTLCTRMVEQTARTLVRLAVRLSHGRAPRAHIRYLEETGNLRDCNGQPAQLLFALGLATRGLIDWMGRLVSRSSAFSHVMADEGLVYRAAVEAVGLALRGIDLRAMDRSRRREARAMIAQLHDLFRFPATAFDPIGSAQLLATAAPLCDALIADRDELAALHLVKAARPHLARLGHRHPATFGLRRAHASALCERGQYQQAERLLRSLRDDERRFLGPDDLQALRTREALAWALEGQGRHAEAEEELNAVKAVLTQTSDAEVAQVRHVECKTSWIVGQQDGRVREALDAYDRVITDRCREFGADHPDCLDARHSKGKMLVRRFGDGRRALAVLEPLLADRSRVEGPHHSDTRETRKYVAVASVLADPLDARTRSRAIQDLRRILRFQARRHGPRHPMTIDTVRWLDTLITFSEGR